MVVRDGMSQPLLSAAPEVPARDLASRARDLVARPAGFVAGASRWRYALVVLGATALVLDGRLEIHTSAPLAVDIALALATCLPLAFLTQAPVGAVLLLEGGLVACVLTFQPDDVAVGILTVVLFAAAVSGDRRRSLGVGAVTAVLLAATLALLRFDGHALDADGVTRVLIVLSSIILGDTVRSRRALRAAREDRIVRDQRERESRARQQLARQRLRIARELHDTLAHALVGINVRASVATHLGSERHDAAGALADIKGVSAKALGDLRATLDLLREEQEPAGADIPPAAGDGLEALPSLIAGVRAAGLDTHEDIRVEGTAVPAGVAQAAFRIVQEALTNVLRHAHASTAIVTVGLRAGALAVQVEDDGVGGSRPLSGAGHGLRGMEERVHALGGTVTAGPLASSGWSVRAELPLARAGG
ncbi:MAG TPA: sensor histidine kinase [Solirubrobacteraceae bacterium]|jgi:signal transduction histidine kinase|nr:sensor histidine kinase [Solirubrobacteraceae bacterium]